MVLDSVITSFWGHSRTSLSTIWPGQRTSLRRPRSATWSRDMPDSPISTNPETAGTVLSIDHQSRTEAPEQQNSKDSQPANALQHYKHVLHHSTPCSFLPLNYHMPWLNFHLRHLLGQKARADTTAGISKAWAFRSQRYSDVGNPQPIKSQKWASPFKQPTNTSALGTVLPFSSLRFQRWLWLTSAEQSLLCHLSWAELQHRFTHSLFLLPGDSHTHSFTRLPMQTTLVLRASEISWLPFGEGSGWAHRHLPKTTAKL